MLIANCEVRLFYVKTSALNTRLFANLCADLGFGSQGLLFCTRVSWVSRENMTRVFEPKNYLFEFYEERNHNFKNVLAKMESASRLAYLQDIFDTLNHTNMFFQGPNSIIADVVSKLQAYLRKQLGLWITSVEAKQCHTFKNIFSLQLQHSKKLFHEICCI